METYSENDDLQLDTGKALTDLLEEGLMDAQQATTLSNARERAYNKINSALEGRTALPAWHIQALKQVEIDFVIADIISSAYTMESANTSEWSDKYSARAQQTLDNLSFSASAEEPEYPSSNVGDGALKIISVSDEYAKTEMWTFMAQNATYFSVYGSVSGRLPDLTVGSFYPDKLWTGPMTDYGLGRSNFPSADTFPFNCNIIAGETDFEEGDRFTVEMFSCSKKKKGISTGFIEMV
jgi:hypothetical protein